MPPDDLIDQGIRFIGPVCNTVAVNVIGQIIAPIVSTPFDRPFDCTRPYIFHLRAIVLEYILRDLIAFGTGGKMDANSASFKNILREAVFVGVVEKHTFLCATGDMILFYYGFICIV